MTIKDNNLNCALELVCLISAYLNSIDNAILTPFITSWPAEPFVTRIILANRLPVLNYLPSLMYDNNPAIQKIVKKLQISAHHLAWGQTYTEDDFGNTFLQNYGWTELIGLRGPIQSEQVSCGFLLLGPNINYPSHCHAACEVYIPLTSQTLWKAGTAPAITRNTGSLIYHNSWLPHAMCTGSAPLLALYLWHGGDLAQKSRIS